MNSLKSFIYGAVALMSMGLVACQDNFDDPKMEAPVAKNVANTTIAELKAKFWQDETNYIWDNGTGEPQPIGVKEDGSHYIIHGRVISSDENGNVFKALFIQDETGALPFSINQYNLYTRYRVGQEIVVDLTGMFIGKYNGLQQVGYPQWYEQGKCWEASFMAPAYFESHVELNGFPESEKVDTITIKDFSTLGSAPEDLRKWQGQLVRFNDCYWATPGTTIVNEYHSSGFDQSLNVQGGTVKVRTSGYSRFWNMVLPAEHMDVVGILSYYGSTGWQLILNDANGLMNVGTPSLNKGIKANPYTVQEVIDFEKAGELTSGWVSGYIVGAVAPECETVASNEDIEWTAEVTLANTLVIAPAADVKDYTQCLIISLPQDTPFRQYGNLVEHPENYGKAISVSGNFAKYMNTFAVVDNYGSADEFSIDGVNPGGASEDGDGTQAKPFNVKQVLASSASTDEVWVTGYIVGWVEGQVLSSGAHFDNAATAQSNVLLALTADETDVTKCIPVQLPFGDVRTGLNLQTNPDNYKKSICIKGQIQKYFGQMGVKTVTEYTISGGGDEPTPTPTPGGGGNGTEASPFTVDQFLAGTATGNEVWAEGYIVGRNDGKDLATESHFDAENVVGVSNFLIAASADVKDVAKCVPVQLPASVRAALNLKDNPGNLGKKIKMKGNCVAYFGVAGFKNMTEYKFE